jgi:hypothetical protein
VRVWLCEWQLREEMARLLTLDSVTVNLRNALLGSLRPEDEGLLLPQATQSIESGTFKNCVFRLAGDVSNVNSACFAFDWFSGVSLVQLTDGDTRIVEKLLDSQDMDRALKALADAIPSDVANADVQVGPALECDELERDVEGATWQCGFDSPSAFVGIFAAQNSRPPEVGSRGVNRVHHEYFLACKAGAGIAASTFHSRILAALATPGATLDSVLGEGGTVGAASLRRLASAGARNRHRILTEAAKALGLQGVQSVGDQASRNKYRCAVSDVDVSVNTLRKLDDVSRSTWQVTNSIDGATSKGIVSMSNAADGMILFLNATGEKHIILRQNESWGSVPFSTPRLKNNREMVDLVMRAKAKNVDDQWIRRRFAWKNRQFVEGQVDVAPFAFYGSHDTEQYAKTFGRELGLSNFNSVRLRPELVATAGVDGGKLRPLVAQLGAMG